MVDILVAVAYSFKLSTIEDNLPWLTTFARKLTRRDCRDGRSCGRYDVPVDVRAVTAVREENLVPGMTCRRLVIRRTGLRPALAVAAVLAGVPACGSAGRGSPGASPAASGCVSAYLDRLSPGHGQRVGRLRRGRRPCPRLLGRSPAASGPEWWWSLPPRPEHAREERRSPVLSLRLGSLRQRSAVSSCRSAVLSGTGG